MKVVGSFQSPLFTHKKIPKTSSMLTIAQQKHSFKDNI